MSEPSPAVDLERLVEDLKRRVEARRRTGMYAPGLEAQLDEHARHFAAHRLARPDPLPPLRAAVARVGDNRGIHREEIPPSSSMPLGSLAHKTADRLQRRHLDSLIAQLWTFAAAVTEALERSLDVLEEPRRDMNAMFEQVDAVLERVAALEAGAPLGGVLGSLIDRVERLEAAESDRQFTPFFSNEHFEAAFRGSEEVLRASYVSLADHLVSCQPVVELGCGQGVLLELLAERNAKASGVELDTELVGICQAKGLDVTERNGMHYLNEQDDGSLGALVLLQVIEHLSHQQVSDLFLLAHQKLRPGGVLAIETVNPQSLYVYTRAFYIDPTHSTPVHPAYLEFLSREAGFTGHRIEWRNPVRVEEALTEDSEDARRLNAVVFGPQDYLFLGIR